MMKISNYAYVLKTLIGIANVKMMNVAKNVDYDISYISKWCNDNNLPPKKNICGINKRLAELFASEIVSHKTYSIVSRELNLINIDDQQNKEELIENEIYKVLMSSYEISESTSKKNWQEKTSTVITGRKRIVEYLSKTIRAIIENSNSDINLICTLDIDRLLQIYGAVYLRPYHLKNNIRIFANLGLNINLLKTNYEGALNRIYSLLNSKLECEFTLFNNSKVEKYNVLVIQDKIAFLFSVDYNGDIDMAIEIKDKVAVNEIYFQANSKLKATNIILRPTDNSSMEHGGFRTKFYTAPEFEFFSVYGFEFFLPKDIVDSLSREAVAQSGNKNMAAVVKKLQIAWEERFINAEINFTVPKSAVMRYVEKGVMYYMDVHYQATVEQRRQHVRQFIEHMKKNRKINLFILEDDYFLEEFFQISIYFNHKMLFLKKNSHSIKNGASRYYVLANEKYIQYVKEYFRNSLSKNSLVKYKVEEIEHIVNKNEKMILRMLDLN
ncbi:hypothetical protein [Anaerotignum sp. MB30-C6]|uniref:hypothetical protein n=1 Tax=Anaerotignum sp. MB30-C6 TaxID=3070814 RepID=UPI0027DB9F02|nr:hypothetical protein [Anaerotignum sp. MB30-C6]WMI82625.1 hypothetical protein RBQ60_07830 [Anaerotignum sp. MB30-C6]